METFVVYHSSLLQHILREDGILHTWVGGLAKATLTEGLLVQHKQVFEHSETPEIIPPIPNSPSLSFNFS